MPDPSPAPDWTTTLWPRSTSSRTPAGVIATRYSSVLISLGTPIFIARDSPCDVAPGTARLRGAQPRTQGGRNTRRYCPDRGRRMGVPQTAVSGGTSRGGLRNSHSLGCLGQDRAQDRLDLLPVLGSRDQRRGELDDGLAAVVGARDQAALEQLGPDEPAQQVLDLG